MKVNYQRLLVVGLLSIGLAASTLISACSKRSEEGPTSSSAGKKDESRVAHGTNGETIIKLNAETQKLMGLQIAALSPAQVSPEIKGFGRVLDSSSLASLVADFTSASAANTASQAELARLKTLASQN